MFNSQITDMKYSHNDEDERRPVHKFEQISSGWTKAREWAS